MPRDVWMLTALFPAGTENFKRSISSVISPFESIAEQLDPPVV
jgi:hypothetical protein